METWLNDSILQVSNLKSPWTEADHAVSDSSPVSPEPAVGQSLLQTVMENEAGHLSSRVLGEGHKSFHSAMRATSLHFPKNRFLTKKYWWFSLEQFLAQRQLKTICTNDAKYHSLSVYETEELGQQQDFFEHNHDSTYMIWEQKEHALHKSCPNLQHLFLPWKQFNP